MTFLHTDIIIIIIITRKSMNFAYHLLKLPIIKAILAKSKSVNDLLIPL